MSQAGRVPTAAIRIAGAGGAVGAADDGGGAAAKGLVELMASGVAK
jgi:hypothetical protein